MYVVTICVLISSFSFFGYALAYFKAPHMKAEFKRYGLGKWALTVIVLEILGGIGLLVGLKVPAILMISSLGLTLLMLAALIVRIGLKDSILASFPAFFFMALNAVIFWLSLDLQS